MNKDTKTLGKVVQIDEARIRDHLGELVRGTVEETLNNMLDAEADAALEIAGSSPDLDVRRDAYQVIAERIAAGRPHIYLYDRADIDLLAEDFMGYNMNVWETVAWNSEEWWLDR